MTSTDGHYEYTPPHGPRQQIPGREVDLQEHGGFKVEDVVITRAGDGMNPGIIRRIIRSVMAHEREVGATLWSNEERYGAIFAEIEEVATGRIVTTLVGEDFLEHANPMVVLAVARSHRDDVH